MSSWHVIQVVTPLMMASVKMYIIIIFTLMTTIAGSPQTCLHYCKQSPTQSPIPPPECDCSFLNLRKPRFTTTNHEIVTPSDKRDSEHYFELAKFKASQTQSIPEQTFHNMLNFSSNLNFTQYITNNTKFNNSGHAYNTSKSFAVQDTYNQHHDNKFSHKYETKNYDMPNSIEETKDLPLHLYLDIDLDTSENTNTSQLEKLINMFENFQSIENNLSECINLHIYIFSRYINKTSKNWDPNVKHDTLTNSLELTEIQNKCSQPSSIIKQSLYQIKQSLPKKLTHSDIIQDKQQETAYSVESKDGAITQNKLFLSRNNKNSTISSDSHTSTTFKIRNDSIVTSEISTTEESNDVQSDKKYTEHDDLNVLFHDYFTKKNSFTQSLPAYNDDNDKTHVAVTSERGNTIITTKPNRTVYSEGDLQIPRIITKELSYDKVLSVVDGNEEIPNSDFITYSISSTTTDEYPIANDVRTINASISDADILNTNIDKSNLIQIHGELYVLFGKKQIPARFIQQPNGELHVAIDGFSLCHEMLKENTTNFMNSFCNCIKLQN